MTREPSQSRVIYRLHVQVSQNYDFIKTGPGINCTGRAERKEDEGSALMRNGRVCAALLCALSMTNKSTGRQGFRFIKGVLMRSL